MIKVNMKYMLLLCTVMFLNLSAFSNFSDVNAKKTIISGSINLDDSYVIQVSELFNKQQGEDYPLTANGTFQVDLDLAEPTWVEVSFVPTKRDRQLGATFPLFLNPGDKLKIDLTYDKETYLQLLPKSSKSENRALIEYASFSNSTMRDLFHKRNNPEEYQKAVESYLSEAQVLAKKYKVRNVEINDYLTLWSYNNYLSVATTSKQITIPEEKVKEILSIMDGEMTLTFWNGISNVSNFVNPLMTNDKDPVVSMSNKIDQLNELLKTDALVSAIIQNDLERYVSSYRITDNGVFESDIKRLESLLLKIKDEQLRLKILNDFKNLRYTSTGSLYPSVKFKDVNGKEFTLDQFKGKYVYIDLWASWCVPCIKEIPYLNELEKIYKDKNIVFVSISLDSDKAAWRKKMTELNLHGYQWELGDSNYDKLMNVTGIPHFILYGPNGELIQYKAPRPSSKEIKTIFNNI